MRHSLRLQEATLHSTDKYGMPLRDRRARGEVVVEVEYAQAHPADTLMQDVVRAFWKSNLPGFKAALKIFTSAGYDPSLIRSSQQLVDGDAIQFRTYGHQPQPLLRLAWDRQEFPFVKALVQAGVSPFEPCNVVLEAIKLEKGPSSAGRAQWTWFVNNTPLQGWLKTVPTHHLCSDPDRQEKLVDPLPNTSLVHRAIVSGNLLVVEALLERWGASVLKAEGPDLMTWVKQGGSVCQTLFATMEDVALQAVVPTEIAPPIDVRARL